MSPKGPSPAGVAAPIHHHHRMMRRTASGHSHSAAAASTVSGAVVPPTELSSAITFLGETALYQACDLLIAQSESLFGGVSTSTAADETEDELKDGGDKITSSNVNVAMSEDAPLESDAKQTQGQKKAGAGESPSPSCVQRLTLLYGKCKNAQNIILRADEAGMINDTGLPSAPSLMLGGTASGNNLACQPSPMPRIAPSGSMPPPPTSMHLNRNLSSSSSLTPGGGGSLHRSRGSFSTGNNGGLSSNNPRIASNDNMNNSNNNLALLRRKSGHITAMTAVDHNHGTGTNKEFHRTTSDGSDAATAGSHHKNNTPKEKKQANPPPEVLNFLRQLNSRGSESQQQIGTLEGFDEVAGTSNSNTPKKRKANSPPLPPVSQPPSAAKRGKMDASERAQAALSNNPKLKPSALQKPSPPPPPNARPPITRTPSGKVKPQPPSKTPDPSAGRSTRSTPSSADGATSKTPEASTAAATTSSGGRSTRSKRSTPSSASSTNKTSSGDRVYGIGESVYVKMDGKKYSGIVKNVDYGSDNDNNNDDEEDAGDDGGIMYEVEFSDGEIYDVNPNDMMENEDDF